MVASSNQVTVSISSPYCNLQFAGKFDVVVNCSGLGSRELCKDDKIQPARGHILRVGHPDHVFHLAFHETTSGSFVENIFAKY
jgi:hypothetical protein